MTSMFVSHNFLSSHYFELSFAPFFLFPPNATQVAGNSFQKTAKKATQVPRTNSKWRLIIRIFKKKALIFFHSQRSRSIYYRSFVRENSYFLFRPRQCQLLHPLIGLLILPLLLLLLDPSLYSYIYFSP